jgi:amino acid transporter
MADADPERDPDAPPTPDAALPALDREQVQALRALGRAWRPLANPDGPVLPVDPSLHRRAVAPEPTRWGRLVHVRAGMDASEELEASGGDDLPGRLRRVLLGPPLKSSAIVQERMRKLLALPVLSADGLSSVAYGPEAMLAMLVLAGGAGLGWSVPISVAIACMMVAVGLSYRQTIRAYPHGGGSYIVATENLGAVPGLMAAAGLTTDYVLTVAISISSGLDAVSSALPSVRSAVVPIGIAVIAVLLLGNLRGVRQAATLFAAPTYAFIAAIGLLVAVGVIDAAGRGFTTLPRPALHASEGVGLLLVLRAFSSGATAMTGIEAISNAVPAFQPVEWRNARTTLGWMVALLVAMFAGIVALVQLDGIVPSSHQTVLSQLAHLDFASGPLYVFTQAATALILLFAANTAYNDFPRVLFLLARDRFAAQRYLRMGDRLAFSHGIIALSVVAAAVFVVFSGNTARLIPLYAVGVFLAFTLSQAGMVVHWWRLRGTGWRTSIGFNATGCVASSIVLLVAAVTKFTAGAWLAIAIVTVFTATGLLIRRHFERVADALAIGVDDGPEAEGEETPSEVTGLVIVPVPALNRATMRALAYAASLNQPVLALHIAPTEGEGQRFRYYWSAWGDHLPLQVIESPYRTSVSPTVAYIESLHAQRPELTLTVIVAELVVRRRWQRSLHDDTAARLRRALRPLKKIVVTSVPFHP